jgi:ASF1 like histone chaperone
VASPGNAELDQELDDCLVGPVPIGVNAFEFEGSPPSAQSIPPEDVLGVAALILTGSYRDQEFVRVGYYQNTEYDNEEMKLAPPEKIQFDKLVRDISAKPRVTRFQIKWYVIVSVVVPQIGTNHGRDLAGMSHRNQGRQVRRELQHQQLFPLQMTLKGTIRRRRQQQRSINVTDQRHRLRPRRCADLYRLYYCVVMCISKWGETWLDLCVSRKD